MNEILSGLNHSAIRDIETIIWWEAFKIKMDIWGMKIALLLFVLFVLWQIISIFKDQIRNK